MKLVRSRQHNPPERAAEYAPPGYELRAQVFRDELLADALQCRTHFSAAAAVIQQSQQLLQRAVVVPPPRPPVMTQLHGEAGRRWPSDLPALRWWGPTSCGTNLAAGRPGTRATSPLTGTGAGGEP